MNVGSICYSRLVVPRCPALVLGCHQVLRLSPSVGALWAASKVQLAQSDGLRLCSEDLLKNWPLEELCMGPLPGQPLPLDEPFLTCLPSPHSEKQAVVE